MNTPLVSIVIPAYNHERFVGAAIESVLNQTCADFELVIVNDGSTDRTEEVIRSYEDQRIRYYYQENQDAYNTINRGLSLSKGRYIAILNSDDLYSNDRLESMLEVFEQRDVVCAFSKVIPIDEEGVEYTDPQLWWNIWYRKNIDHYHHQNGDMYASFLHGNLMITTSNLFITAEAVNQVGSFYPLRYLHDYDYILRTIHQYKDKVVYLDDQRLLYYRIHGGNTLSEAAIIGREQDKELIKKYMLEALPVQYRRYVEVGSSRLVELENELNQVRQQLHPSQKKGVRAALNELKIALGDWGNRKVHKRH